MLGAGRHLPVAGDAVFLLLSTYEVATGLNAFLVALAVTVVLASLAGLLVWVGRRKHCAPLTTEETMARTKNR